MTLATPPYPTAPPAPEAQAQTRDRLLDAAETLFAERGFRAASVREITQEAGCNLAAVNYHFGSKHELYREVVMRRLQALRDRRIGTVRRTMEEAGSSATVEMLLGAFTTAFVEPLIEGRLGRTWMNLLSREMLDPQLPAEFFLEEMTKPVQTAVADALCRIHPTLERDAAERCTHSLIAQLVHAVRLAPIIARSGDEAMRQRFSLPALTRHVVQFSAAGVRALAGAGGR